MSSAKCAACGKTAYPLESYSALDKTFHKMCFKCSVCAQSLSLKNFKGLDGKLFCAVHTPKPQATVVTDSIAVKNAVNAPKKSSEGLGHVQKGIGGKPAVTTFGAAPGEPSAASAGGDGGYDAGGGYEDQSGGYDQSAAGYEEQPQEEQPQEEGGW